MTALSALDLTLAEWASGDLDSVSNFVVTNDNEKDELFGEQGDDYLFYGNGDKRKN